MITQERLHEVFSYHHSGLLINKVRRGNSACGKIAGRVMDNGYIRISVDRKEYAAHRLVWLYHHGYFPEHDLDHVNGDRSDNRVENLRQATRAENMQNEKRARANNKTGLLGVCPHGSGFRAQITVLGKVIRLGTFRTPQEAHKIYLQHKRDLHPYQTIA